MSLVIAFDEARRLRAAQARLNNDAQEARNAALLRDAAECCATALDERDIETARDALAALIADALAPENMRRETVEWRGRKILSLALRLVNIEAEARRNI